MKRDDIIGQKLFETCKLSEFYLNLVVNSKYEDESPFQLAKAYTLKLYEIVERYDRLLNINSQREQLSLQLDATSLSIATASANGHPPQGSGGSGSTGEPQTPSSASSQTNSIYGSKLTLNERFSSNATAKRTASVLSNYASGMLSGGGGSSGGGGVNSLCSPSTSSARTSTPNKCFLASPSSSAANQLQLQLNMHALSSQSTATHLAPSQSVPVTPSQSKTASSINLSTVSSSNYGQSSNNSSTGLKQSNSNYLLSSQRRLGGASSCLKLSSNSSLSPSYSYLSNASFNKNANSFYRNNPQRYNSIYDDDYYSSSSDCSNSSTDDENDDEDENVDDDEVVEDEEEEEEENMSDDETVITNSGHNFNSNTLKSGGGSVGDNKMFMSDISYGTGDAYGEYSKDNEIDLKEDSGDREETGNSTTGEEEEDEYEDEEMNRSCRSNTSSQIIEKSYSNLSKDSGVLIESYHSEYNNNNNNNCNSSLTHCGGGGGTLNRTSEDFLHAKSTCGGVNGGTYTKKELLSKRPKDKENNNDDGREGDEEVDDDYNDEHHQQQHEDAANESDDQLHQLSETSRSLRKKMLMTSRPRIDHSSPIVSSMRSSKLSLATSPISSINSQQQQQQSKKSLSLIDEEAISSKSNYNQHSYNRLDELDVDTSTMSMVCHPQKESSSLDEPAKPDSDGESKTSNSSDNSPSKADATPFLFTNNSLMNMSMLDNIQVTNPSLDFDNMNNSILMFN